MSERRKRISIPRTILAISLILFLSPIYNLVLQTKAQGLNLQFSSIFKLRFQYYDFFFLFAPVVSALGLIRIKKWGWYLFLFYSLILISFNIYATIKYFTVLNLYSLFESSFVFLAIVYFLQKDISAPYFKLYPRGWRLEKRKPIQVKLKINSKEFLTRDISDKGFYVDWIDVPLEINSEVNVDIPFKEETKTLKAGLVRIDEKGAGFAFRNLNRDDELWLGKVL